MSVASRQHRDRFSQRQVRVLPPEAEVHGIGATLETGFTLTLQSEYPAATRQERTTTNDRQPGIIGQTQSPFERIKYSDGEKQLAMPANVRIVMLVPASGYYIAKSTRLLANVASDCGLPFGTRRYWPPNRTKPNRTFPGCMKCYDCANNGCSREQHRQQQQTASQEDCCEKLIFAPTKPVSKHTHKPKKGDAGERHEVHRDRHIRQATLKPSPRLERIAGDRKPHEPEYREQQYRKQDTSNSRGSRGSQMRVRKPRLVRVHRRLLFPRIF